MVLTRSLLANEGEALRIGDVLGQYADHKLRAAAWSESDRELVKRMLPVLVSGEGTPLIVPVDQITARVASTPRAAELLRDLTDFRLLTSLRDERGREALTPVHTTLIQGWSLLREALEGTAELEAFLRRFDRDAREWHASQRDPAKLWPAAATRDFERWQAALTDIALSPTQRDFRGAVVAHAKRTKLVRIGLVVVLAALAIGGTWAGIAFANQADEADALRNDALVQKTNAERQTALSEAHRREADELIDFMVGDLRTRLEPIGQVKILRTVAEKAQGYLDRRGSLDDAADVTRRATVLRNLSAVFFEEGDTAQAEKTARASVELNEQTATASGTALAKRELALSKTTLGVALLAKGDYVAALDSYKAALLLYDGLAAAAPDDLTAQRDVSVIQDRIGDALTTLGQHDAALHAYKSSQSIADRLLAANPDEQNFERDAMVAANKVAVSLQFQGDLQGARAIREKAIPIVEGIAIRRPDSAMAQRDVAVSRAALGDIYMMEMDTKRALESYAIALEIDKRLAAADPSSANAQRDLEIAHNKVGDAKYWSKDPAGALAEYSVSIGIARKLAASDPVNMRFQHDLAQTLSRLANAKIALGDVEPGLAALAEMVAIVEALDKATGTDLSRIDLVQAIASLASGLGNSNKNDEAVREAERARALLAPLLAKPSAQVAWRDLDQFLERLVAEKK